MCWSTDFTLLSMFIFENYKYDHKIIRTSHISIKTLGCSFDAMVFRFHALMIKTKGKRGFYLQLKVMHSKWKEISRECQVQLIWLQKHFELWSV